uniref:Tic20 family protein Ycf60 n=1 Tax=Harveyella mirabilis TaxID=282355 RepID=A0A3S8UW40_9FLOR|nr:hypothetical protein [Harveyella mirabilis]
MFYYFLYIIIILFFILLFYQIYSVLFKKNLYDDKNITLIDRLGSIFFYGLPFLEGMRDFNEQILLNYPSKFKNIYQKIISPLISFYINCPLLIIAICIVSYCLFIKAETRITYRSFLCFNILQAFTLFLINSLLGKVFKTLSLKFRFSFYGLILYNILLWFTISIIIYSVIKSLQGQYTRIPIISQALIIQIENY